LRSPEADGEHCYEMIESSQRVQEAAGQAAGYAALLVRQGGMSHGEGPEQNQDAGRAMLHG
jgi:hypothetical protein